MPASSQASPTSGMRRTSSPHSSQRIGTSSIHGRCSSCAGRARRSRAPQLGPRADHVEAAALARVEGERQAEVPLARDVPVAHVAEPVVHALRIEIGRPLHRRVRLQHRLANLVAGDEPLVDDAEDERRVAAPANWVTVDDLAGLEQAPALAEVADDLVLRLGRRGAVQPAVGVRRRNGRPRPPGSARAGRGRARARSPRRRSPARCGRCRCPPPWSRRPTG